MNPIKSQARQFALECGFSRPSLEDLTRALQNRGYTLVEYDPVYNEGPTAALIAALGLEAQIARSPGFTYADSLRRLVFLCEGLSPEEKLLVLAHEAGHIVLGHMAAAPILGATVTQEQAAGDFCRYLLSPGPGLALERFWRRHKLWVLLGAATAVLALALLLWPDPQPQYYRTASGTKYHTESCVYIVDSPSAQPLSPQDLESGRYTPCDICRPAQR